MPDSQPQRRRRRPAVSCTLCRQRKIRCNRETPCSNCIRSRNSTCEYETLPVLPHRSRESDRDEASITTISTTAPLQDMDSMRNRVTLLENQLENALRRVIRSTPPAPSTAETPVSSIETADSRIGGTFYIHHGDPALGQSPNIHRSLTHKKRMYGQSHWMNMSVIMVQDIAQMIDGQARDPSTQDFSEKVFSGMHKCKRIARLVKSQREPPWPCSPTPELPPKNIADDLVDCYLRTFESVYRILHIPSFKRTYEAIWVTEGDPDSTFLVQLKLVLAIGATSYNNNFTLRPSAMRWVHEAETFLTNPHLKHRLGIQYIQIYCLQLLARQTAAVGEDMVFISTGSLIRSAMFLGLHRDPAHLPARTLYANEMHRRLWTTVIELCLQASIYAGCPPLLSQDDYDTQPAGNFDDDQLENNDAIARPETFLTQSSVSIILRRTFPARLAIAAFLNNFTSTGTFEETLQLDSELRIGYKALRDALRGFDSNHGNLPSDFQIRVVDTVMNRYLCAVHTPFFGPALKDAKYAFSRKTVFDTALKMWYAIFPASNDFGSSSSSGTTSPVRDDLQRIVTCGQGFLRSAVLQSILMIAVEMRTQIQEDDGLSPTPLRRDLFAIIQEAKSWSIWCMEAGETNVKALVFVYLMEAYTKGLAKGLGKEAIGRSLVEASHNALQRGMVLLEGMMETEIPNQDQAGLGSLSLNDLTPEMLADWQSIIPTGMNDPYGYDMMNWAFDQTEVQNTWLF
ncbi:C6 transcription factor [Paraphaeosphaeria sporulosa]